jgi:hypothetical protein
LFVKRAILAISVASLGTISFVGCGVATQATTCSAGPLTTLTSGSPNFTLAAADSDLTIYPGQTKQIPVVVQAVGTAQGTVLLGGESQIQGLTVSGGSAVIGSTANITVTATNNVAADCFVGAEYVFTGARAITLSGSNTSGSIKTGVAMNIVLENPAFVPASTNLPVISINTANAAPVTSEDDYVDATIKIVDSTNSKNNYTGTMGIKGHGNSTWAMPKKPYRLNLDSKAPLLGMTSDSNWILLANYDDKAMIRNDVSMEMSRMFGLAWTPAMVFAEVYLNGVYNGTYQLSEKVEVSKARLDIGSIDDTDNSGADLTGGYLGEIDHYYGETFMMTSLAGLPIGIADPDPPTATQSAYFTGAFRAAESALYKNNFTDPTVGWQASWNKASAVNYFLVEELAGNQDADDWSSYYFYKPRSDDLFYFGPVWDMDVTLGNNNYGVIASPTVPWVSTQSQWYAQLFKDPAFLAAVKAQWTAVRPQIATLPAYIDTRSAALRLAAQNNYSRWPTLGEKIWPNATAAGTYQGEVDFLKNWLTQRIAYMDAHYK